MPLLARSHRHQRRTPRRPQEAAQTLYDAIAQWSDLLAEEVDDPVLADTILVGDGLYLATVTGLPRPDQAWGHPAIADLERRVEGL